MANMALIHLLAAQHIFGSGRGQARTNLFPGSPKRPHLTTYIQEKSFLSFRCGTWGEQFSPLQNLTLQN